MGNALGAFFGRTGPPEVVDYSFKSQRSFHHATYVEHVAVVEPGPSRLWNKIQCHEDTFRITKEGQERLEFDVKTGKSTNAVLRSFCCAGKGYGPYGGSSDICNCRRACGVLGECNCSDSKKLGHCCEVRVKVSATLSQVEKRIMQVDLTGTHVPEDYLHVGSAIPPQGLGFRV